MVPYVKGRPQWRVFEKKMLRRTFRPKEDDVTRR
jgi:hypothetical protein